MLILPRQARSAPASTTRFAHPMRIAPLLSLALLAGCSTASYPSLALRPGETTSVTTPKPAPTTAPAASALPQQLHPQWLADARAADARFAAARPAAEKALTAAQGATPGSEAWSIANLALTDLERARGDVAVAQAAVESAYTEDRLAHATDPATSPTPIAAIRDAITAITESQDKVLAKLRARLNR